MIKVARTIMPVLFAVLLFAQPASAGILEYGLGARAVGMGQAQVAAANDVAGLIYNPAALTYAREYWDLDSLQFFTQMQMVGTHAQLYLNDVNQEDAYTSAMVQSAIIPLSKRVTTALSLYMPDDTTLTVEFGRGPTIQRFRATRWFYLSVGGGLQLTRKLSIGGGSNFTLGFNTSPLNLDMAPVAGLLGLDIGAGTKELNPGFEIDTIFLPSYEAGILYRPFKWLHLGAFYREKLGNKFNALVQIPKGLTPETTLTIEGYMFMLNPPQYSLGIAVMPIDGLTLAFDMQRDLWSEVKPWLEYRGSRDNMGFKTDPGPDIKLKDRWWPKAGVEWKDNLGGNFSRMTYALRAGYSYYESPFPEMPKDGISVDNNAHFYSGGFSIGYSPRRRLEYISIDYFYEYVDLVEREHKNIHNNPATIVSDGYVIYQGFGATVKM